ncbi:MAG TPA: hypothetical protein VK619_08865 [Pyrinomonadaceae bacterium]|nr:hypothetical protein [Pyrinomonadaceae bacterium]
MPSFYGIQTPVSAGNVGPQDETYAPVPGLGTLSITDDFLQFGGTASVTLFLGSAASIDVDSFNMYVQIVDLATKNVVSEVFFYGGNGYNGMVIISAVYQIAPGTQPVLQAQWKVLGTPGIVIAAPTTISFSAAVFESQGN